MLLQHAYIYRVSRTFKLQTINIYEKPTVLWSKMFLIPGNWTMKFLSNGAAKEHFIQLQYSHCVYLQSALLSLALIY